MFSSEGANAAQQKLGTQHATCNGALVGLLVVEEVHPAGDARFIPVGMQQIRHLSRQGHSRWCGGEVGLEGRGGLCEFIGAGAGTCDTRVEDVPSGRGKIASGGADAAVAIVEADVFSFPLWGFDYGAPGRLGDDIEGAAFQFQPLTICAHGLLLVAAGMARFAGEATLVSKA